MTHGISNQPKYPGDPKTVRLEYPLTQWIKCWSERCKGETREHYQVGHNTAGRRVYRCGICNREVVK